MADESPAVATETGSDIGDISLDAMNAVETDTSTTDETTEETTESTDEEQSQDGEQTPEDDDDTTDADKTEDKPDDEPAEPKLTRRERAERYAQEQAAKQQVEQAVNQVYQPQDVAELRDYYMEQGADEFQALQLARQDVADQKAQIAEATTQIAELNANLRVDAVEARAKYDWMNPANEGKGYDKDTTAIAAQMFELATVKDERTGQIVDAKMTPSQIADIIDKVRTSAMKEATVKAQKNAESQMASVAPPTSARQPVKQGDSLEDMKARLANIKF